MNFTKRQLEIMEEAVNLIDQGGIQNLTTRNLAASMKFTEPALYRHFKNKTEILNSVLVHYQSVLREGMKPEAGSQSGLEQLLDVVEFQFQQFTGKPALIMVIFSESSFQNDSMLQETVANIIAQKEQRVQEIIKKGQLDGSINPALSPHELANIVMGAMRFTALRWKLSGFQFDLLNASSNLQQTIHTMIKSIN